MQSQQPASSFDCASPWTRQPARLQFAFTGTCRLLFGSFAGQPPASDQMSAAALSLDATVLARLRSQAAG